MTDPATLWGLMIIALVSAELNFAGLIQLIEKHDWWLRALAGMASAGVWMALYLFWSHCFAIIPDLVHPERRRAAWATVAAGCVTILALSAYWNVVALAGSEVRRLWLESLVPQAESTIADATAQIGVWLALAPGVQAFIVTVEDLAKEERVFGTLSGTPGTGAVESTLSQIHGRIIATYETAADAATMAQAALDQAGPCLEDLRTALAGGATREERLRAAGAPILCLNEIVAEIAGHDPAGLVQRGMAGLMDGIVLPATLRSAGQQQALIHALEAIRRQADSLAEAADELASGPAEPLLVEEPNVMKAVILFAPSIVPAIATAVAIDMLPLFLLILQVLRRRDRSDTGRPPRDWSLADVAAMRRQWRALQADDASDLADPAGPSGPARFTDPGDRS